MAAGWAGRLESLWWRSPPSWGARSLQPLSWLFAALARLRRWLHGPPATVDVPVIVIGNLVAGGAGKTPTVLHVLDLLSASGWTPGVVSRGYGRRGDGLHAVNEHSRAADCGDEPLLIHRRARVPVVVGRDRVAALRRLREVAPTVDVVVSDDGLQHHRLPRTVQVIVFDERGLGNGLRLPAGPLRENLPSRLPEHSLVVYNAPAPSTSLPGWLGRRRLGAPLPLDDWRTGSRSSHDWAVLRGRRLCAAAGTAVPERFFSMLEAQGLSLDRLPLADHHRFDPLPWPAGTSEVVLTEKDAVKIDAGALGATRVWVVPLDFDIEPDFAAALSARLPPRTLP